MSNLEAFIFSGLLALAAIAAVCVAIVQVSKIIYGGNLCL